MIAEAREAAERESQSEVAMPIIAAPQVALAARDPRLTDRERAALHARPHSPAREGGDGGGDEHERGIGHSNGNGLRSTIGAPQVEQDSEAELKKKMQARALAFPQGQMQGEMAVKPKQEEQIKMRFTDLAMGAVLVRRNAKPITLICSCWLALCIMQIWTAPKCSGLYWTKQVLIICVCAAFTVYSAYELLRNQKTKEAEQQQERV